jgi:hypothetical protein
MDMIEDYDEITDPRWRNALTYGIILAIINAASSLLVGWTISASPGASLLGQESPTAALTSDGLGCVSFLIQLGLLFAAGMMTARISGSVGGASWTGMVAGLIGGFFGSFATLFIFYLLIMPSIRIPAGVNITTDELQSAILLDLIIVAVFSIVIDGGVGAGVAALGGLVGRAGYDADVAEDEKQYNTYHGPRRTAPPEAYTPYTGSYSYSTNAPLHSGAPAPSQYPPDSGYPAYTERAAQYESQFPQFSPQRDSSDDQLSFPPSPASPPPGQ